MVDFLFIVAVAILIVMVLGLVWVLMNSRLRKSAQGVEWQTPRAVIHIRFDRLAVCFFLSLVTISFGLLMRAMAISEIRKPQIEWNGINSSVTGLPSPGYLFLLDLGQWSLGFGVVLLLISMGIWASKEPPRATMAMEVVETEP